MLCGVVLLAATFLDESKAENKEEEIMDCDNSVSMSTPVKPR